MGLNVVTDTSDGSSFVRKVGGADLRGDTFLLNFTEGEALPPPRSTNEHKWGGGTVLARSEVQLVHEKQTVQLDTHFLD